MKSKAVCADAARTRWPDFHDLVGCAELDCEGFIVERRARRDGAADAGHRVEAARAAGARRQIGIEYVDE